VTESRNCVRRLKRHAPPQPTPTQPPAPPCAAARDEDAYDFFNAAVRVAAAATDAYTAAKALKFALEAAHKEMTDEQS
jgi:hypothetical protein